MKKRSLSGFIILSIMLVGTLSFAGCATDVDAELLTANTDNAQTQITAEKIPESVSDDQVMSDCMIDAYS